MKILMVAEKDAANSSLGRIAESFLNRGHEIVVYAMYYETDILRYFNSQISRYPLCDLTGDAIDECDCIFTSVVALSGIVESRLLSVHKPIFTQGYLIDDTIQWGGDFCFLPSLKTTAAEYDENIIYSKLEIGEPKYDEINKAIELENRLLFIDSGHYPFGEQGKRELARTLLKICDTYTDYELWIKPRFLPGDKIITHRNTRHLYDVLREEAQGRIPENLVMLKEHRDLKELIDSAHTVICMFTSAFVGAYAAGKGLVVLDCLPSEDIYDVRWKRFNCTRNRLKESGALVDYRDANSLLPHGVQCSEDYLKYLLAEREDVSGKICEVTEYLCQEFYLKGKFPSRVECSYQNIYQQIKVNEAMTWEKVVSDRYLNCLSYKSFILISFHVNATLNVSIIQEHFKYLNSNGLMTEEEFIKESKATPKCWEECIVANQSRMLEDDIDSGILLNVLYRIHRTEEIKDFPKKNIGAYHLYRGLVARDEKEMDLAIAELKQYMKASLGREYIKEISDMPNDRMRAFRVLVENLPNHSDAGSEYYMEEMRKYFDSLYPQTGRIMDRNHAHHYAFIKWYEYRSKGYGIPPSFPDDEKIIVYGAGMLSRKLLLREEKIKNRIKAFIDIYLKRSELEDIPIIGLEQIQEYLEVNTIVVTVLHEYDKIKEKILLVRPEANVVPIVDME